MARNEQRKGRSTERYIIFLEQREDFWLEKEKGERIFFLEEQRDPHEEGSHLNASKANFFVNTGEFLK